MKKNVRQIEHRLYDEAEEIKFKDFGEFKREHKTMEDKFKIQM